MASVAGIRLFDHEPDLLAAVPEADRARASRGAVLPSVRVMTGALDVDGLDLPRWGALILDGLVAREVTVAGTAAAELLGAGDLLLPSSSSSDELLVSGAGWTVLEPLHLALLDIRFQALVRHWPEVAGCLLERADRRASRLAVAQAISHLTRVDTRVLVMLWTLAGRWGRVGASGIVVPLRLTHRTLARLVGARRPSVTTAISELTRRELIARRDDGSWLLHGPPPEELERVGIDRILPTPAPAHVPPHVQPGAVPGEPPRAPAPIDGRATLEAAERTRAATRLRAERLRVTTEQIGALASAYEAQAERTRAIATRTAELRERSRAMRERSLQARARRAGRDG